MAKRRRLWECPVYALNYGGNGTKNPHGEQCRKCGCWNPDERQDWMTNDAALAIQSRAAREWKQS